MCVSLSTAMNLTGTVKSAVWFLMALCLFIFHQLLGLGLDFTLIVMDFYSIYN